MTLGASRRAHFEAGTTLRPIEGSPDEVRQGIAPGGVHRIGDKVSILTQDGSAHEFRVAQIDAEKGLLAGNDDTIRIDEIVVAEKRVRAIGRTAGLAFLIVSVCCFNAGP